MVPAEPERQRIRLLKSYPLARFLYLSGITPLLARRSARRHRHVLMLHDVLDERRGDLPAASQKGLTVAEADALLEWVGRRFRLLSPEAFLHSDEPGVLLTADDGKANNATQLLPLLERHGAPALLFVSTRHVGDPRDWLPDARQAARAHWNDEGDVPEALARALYDGMSAEQLRRCDRHPLVTIAAHSVNHPRLTACTDAELTHELEEGRGFLERMLEHEVDVLAYPYGDYDGRVLQAARDAGYAACFAVDRQHYGPLRYEIPRLHVETMQPHYIAAKLSGLARPPLRGRP